MHPRKTLLPIAVFSVILFSCSKKDQQASTGNSDPNACVNTTTPSNGDIIAGRYIVAYNSDVLQSRTMSVTQREQASESILERNNIAASRLQNTFEGAPGGFIADLSPDEVAMLKKDHSVAMVESDRVITLSNCFTVAEPRLVTWNVTRVGYGDGTGKTAWIIDTGIDFGHPDLNVDVQRSKNFVDPNGSATDDNGHGTHVAGIIAACK